MNLALRTSLTSLILAAIAIGSQAKENKIVSPDGHLTVSVEDRDGLLYYSVAYDGRQMIKPSQLGVIANTGDFSRQLTFKSADRSG